MKSVNLRESGVIILVALVLAAFVLTRSIYPEQLLGVGLSLLIILIAFSYALARSYRAGKRLEREVQAQSQKSSDQSIIDGIAEPIMVIGTDYQVKLMNQAARQFSSTEGGEPKSARCYQISHHRQIPCSGAEHPCPLEQVRASQGPVRVIHEHYQANGEQRLVEVVASPLWKSDAAFQGIIETMRDVTERERSEAALQEYASRLRLLAAQLAEVQDAERQRLSQELHDQVGQNLTALGINLNIIKSQLPKTAGEAACSRLDDSLSLVDQTAERIRDLMADLRPPVLDDYGLLATLRWYGEQFTRRTGIPVEVAGEESLPRLNTRLEITLFRIAQEAMTNVAKHAQAKGVKVKVEVEGEAVRLLVADDGIGFDPAHPAEAARGWGLLSMSERAEAVGGRCVIESSPQKGTLVSVEVSR